MIITTEYILELHSSGHSLNKIAEITKLGKSTISWRLKKHRSGVLISPSAGNRIDWEAVQAYHNQGHTFAECRRKFGFAKESWAKAVRRGDLIARSHIIPLTEMAVENSPHSRKNIKRRLILENILLNQCALCSAPPEWQGKPLVMVLDHINGVNNDNRLENLRLLCPNCNSQTDTFAGRNAKKK